MLNILGPQIPERNFNHFYNDDGILIKEKSSFFKSNNRRNGIKNIPVLQKPIVWVCLVIFISIVVGTVIGVIVLINFNKDKDKDSNDGVNEPTIPHFSSTSTVFPTSSSTTSEKVTTTSTETTTVYVNPEPYDFFNRSEWKALPMKGKFKLTLPVKRIILMDTQTEPCKNFEGCKLFMQKHQNDSYMSRVGSTQIQDIPENFLIATDGMFFEGRGFSYEGQHTIDAGTLYSNGALGISFIGNYTTNELSSDQKESFKYFINKFVEEGKLAVDYTIFYKLQIIKSSVADDMLYDYIRTFENWKESMKTFLIV